jgi:hypothetical protein
MRFTNLGGPDEPAVPFRFSTLPDAPSAAISLPK